jgi:hypothetical protein
MRTVQIKIERRHSPGLEPFSGFLARLCSFLQSKGAVPLSSLFSAAGLFKRRVFKTQMFARPYDFKAAYTFFRHLEATPDNLQAGHRERVLCEMGSADQPRSEENIRKRKNSGNDKL